MREELRLRVRDELSPRSASVVLRGGPDTGSLLRPHARRLHRLSLLDDEPVFGVSLFVASDDIGPTSERTILSKKLHTSTSVYRLTVGDLAEAGFGLLPTFTAPHFTLLLTDLDDAEALAVTLGEPIANPYAAE